MPSFGLPSARAEASRKNGARSRGPKTPEGKARSAQNALKHGFRAQRYVVLPDEDAAAFQELEAALMEELAPQGVFQTVLAQRVVAATWRLERAERLEAELFAENHLEDGNLGLALIRDCRRGRAFESLVRYRGGTLAEFWRALRTLKALQAEEAAPQAGAGLPAPARPAIVVPAATPGSRDRVPTKQPNKPKSRTNAGDSGRFGGDAAARTDDPGAHGALPSPLPPAEPAPHAVAKASASLLAGTALVPATGGKPGWQSPRRELAVE